jgi:hypothetical protein
MKRYTLSGAAVMLCILSFSFGYATVQVQQEAAVITFLSGNVDVDRTPDNDQEDFNIAELDLELPRGSIVRTGRNGYCELTLIDGSLIRIAPTSVFKIEDLSFDQTSGSKRALFNLLFGKVKSTVSKLTTDDSSFELRSGTSLAGVRGTTFGVFYDGVKSQVLIFEGSVSLESVTMAFEPLVIKEGRFSTVPADGLAEPVVKIPKELWQAWDEEFRVFGEEVQPIAAGEIEEMAGEGEEKEEKHLSFSASVGSVTAGSKFYGLWAFHTEYNQGKFGVGMYLPFIFPLEQGIYSYQDWYNRGDWDFTDFSDAVHDLLVKICLKYGEYGDPLSFQLGGLERVTFNNGFIVDGYTNMLFSPLKQNAGATLNADLGYVGMETFSARVDQGLQTSGVRAYVRPLGEKVPLSLGASVFHDRPKPDSGLWPVGPPPLNQPTANEAQLPHIIIVGANGEIPLTNLEKFSMVLYGDVAGTGYQYNQLHPSLVGTGVQEGKIQFLKSLGTAFGLTGTVGSVVDYRAEYRYLRDYYEPGMINFNWDNRRLTYQQELLNLIQAQKDPAYEDKDSIGFYLSAGASILQRRLSFGLGAGYYERHMAAGSDPVDQGRIYVTLEEGLIPGFWGGIIYDRADDFGGLFKDFIDENTLFDVRLNYRLAPMLTLSLNIRRTYELTTPVDIFSIDTRVSF